MRYAIRYAWAMYWYGLSAAGSFGVEHHILAGVESGRLGHWLTAGLLFFTTIVATFISADELREIRGESQ